MASLSEADKKRVQKHNLLQKFETVKKNYLISFLLCWLLGKFGAHRFYLGHAKLALFMFLFWVAFYTYLIFFAETALAEKIVFAVGAYIIFTLIELFRIPTITQKENDKIKKSLEAEFYL